MAPRPSNRARAKAHAVPAGELFRQALAQYEHARQSPSSVSSRSETVLRPPTEVAAWLVPVRAAAQPPTVLGQLQRYVRLWPARLAAMKRQALALLRLASALILLVGIGAATASAQQAVPGRQAGPSDHALAPTTLAQFSVSVPVPAGDTLPPFATTSIDLRGFTAAGTCGADFYLEFEVRPTADPFTGSVTHSSAALSLAASECGAQSFPLTAVSGLATSTAYKWRARVRSSSGSTSAWVDFNGGATAFVSGIPAPATPTLEAPADDETAVSRTPTFSWSDGGPGVTYTLLIESGDGNATILLKTGLVSNMYTLDGPGGERLGVGMSYRWRVQAASAGGTSSFADSRGFTTLPRPVVTTAAATGVTSASATLNGTVNPGGGATTYAFTYGTAADLAGGTATPVQGPISPSMDVPATQALSGLAPGTRYYFRLAATNESGTAEGDLLDFTTDVAPATGLAPGGTVSIEPTLDWNDVTGVVSYVVEIDDDANLDPDGNDATPPRTRAAGAESTYGVDYDALPLANSQTYHWRVATTGTNGVVVNSAVASFTTTAPTIRPQMNYPVPVAVIADPRDLRFSWSPFTRNPTYTYRLQVDEVVEETPDWDDPVIDVDNGLDIQYTTSALAGSKTYAWRVITYAETLDDASPLAGVTMTYTAPVSFSTRTGHVMAIPAYPTGGVTVYTPTPTLSWYLATSATGLSYDLELVNQTGGEPFTGTPDVTALTAFTYTTAALAGGQTYAWKVRTCVAGTATCSDWSAPATFVVDGTAPAGAPAPPALAYPTAGLTLYGSTVRLSWTSAGEGLTYVAYTFACATPTCTDAPAIDPTNAGYTPSPEQSTRRYDLAVTPGRSYAWYVRSRNSAGTDSAAPAPAYFVVNTAIGSTTPVPSYPTGGATVYTLTPALSWYLSGASTGVTGYEVRWGTSSDPETYLGAGSTSGASNRTFTIPSGLAFGTTYYWHVRVAGTTPWATASFVTTGSTGTAVPVASWPTGGATVWASSQALSWYLSGSSAGVTTYEGELTRLGAGGTTTPFSVSAPTRSYAATGLVGGASYAWRVRSCAGATCSAYSTVATFSVHASVGGAPMPFAESPAAGIVLPDGTAPVLSWSLPVEGASALTYDVEVAGTADMAAPQRFEGLASPQVVLRSLPAGTHHWRVRARDAAGNVSAYSPVERFSTRTSVAVEEAASVPVAFSFDPLYPNPASHTGTVRLGLPEAARVRVVLYDALGRQVSVLIDGERPAGMHRESVDVSALAPGVYVVRMNSGRFTSTRPLIVRR